MTDRVIRVFISSPSDVRPERQIAVRVCARLDREFAYQFRVQPLVWEREPLVASGHFQDGIPDPSTTDIVVVILWLRLGMPLPDAFTGAVSGRVPVTGTEWEFEDALAAARATKRPDLLMYRKQAAPLQALNLDDRDAALAQINQREALLDFLKRWFDGDDNAGVIAASHLFIDEAAFEEMLETHLRELLRKRLQGGEGVPLIAYPGNPFRGLQRFEAEHTAVFFGRARARAELRERLARRAAAGSGFVVVVGASGSGKSSLVRAGLVPDLKLPGMIGNVAICRVATMLPSDIPGDPVTALAAAIVAALPELAELLYDAPTLAAQLRASSAQAPFAVAQGLRAAGRAAGLTERGEARLLVVVDQLEELFTGIATSPEMRATFADALAALASSGQVWVVATLRSDFSDRIEQVPALALLCDGDSRHLLLPPDAAEIGQMIRMPAREAGLRFEVDERSGVSLDDVLREAASRQPGALPLLEFALDQLWHGRTESGFLTYDHYNALGGLEGAIGRRAAEVLAGLPPDVAASWPGVLRALVAIGQGDSAGATARDVALARFSPGTPARALIDAFLAEGARLLVTDDTGTRLRVAHEALLTHWEAARSQIERDRADLQLRARLEQAEERWRTAKLADQPDLLLPHGLPLSEAEDYQHRRPEDLTAEVLAFITLSTAAEAARVQQRLDEERRRVEAEQAVERERLQRAAEVQRLEAMSASRLARRTRWAAAVLGLLLIGAGGLAAFAVVQRDAAAGRRNEALLQESRAMAVFATQASARGDQTTAMLLALSALPDPGFGDVRPMSREAITALEQAWMLNRETPLIGHRGEVNSAAFSPDGKSVVTASDDGTARLWDLSGPRPTSVVLAPVQPDDDRISYSLRNKHAVFAIFSPNGQRVLVRRDDASVDLWDVDRSSADWRRFGGPTLRARLHTGPELEGSRGGVDFPSAKAAVFSRDGRRVFIGGPDGSIQVFESKGFGTLPTTTFEGHTKDVVTLDISRDGTRLVSASRDGTARVWRIDTPDAPPIVLAGHGRAFTEAGFSPDGRRVVTSSLDGTARVWDLAGAEPAFIELPHQGSAVRSAMFSPDGSKVLTAADDGIARLWTVAGATPTFVSMAGATFGLTSARFSPDGLRVATSSNDRTGSLWELLPSGPRRIDSLAGHQSLVNSIAFSPDGRQVVTNSYDGTARIWNALPRAAGRTKPLRPGATVEAVAFSRDLSRIALTFQDDTTQVLNAATGAPVIPMIRGRIDTFSAEHGKCQASSADLSHILIYGEGGMSAWDLSAQPATSRSLGYQMSPIYCAAITDDGRLAFTASHDGKSLVWNLRAEGVPTWLELPEQRGQVVYAASFSRDGTRLAVAAGYYVRLWDVSGEQPVFLRDINNVRNAGAGLASRMVALNDDGRYLVVGDETGEAVLWNLAARPLEAVSLNAHHGAVKQTEVSPDATRVLTRSLDGTALAWQIAGHDATRQSLDPDRIIPRAFAESVSISPDGRFVAMALSNNTALLLWDLSASPPSALMLDEQPVPVIGAAFSADSRQLRWVARDATLHGWSIRDDQGIIAAGRSAIGRCLTPAQHAAFALPFPNDPRLGPLAAAIDNDGRVTAYAPDPSGWCP